MEKLNTTIELCLVRLVQVPNFNSNLQFWFFGPNLPKKGVSGLKLKIRNFFAGGATDTTVFVRRQEKG